jgi:hypothetical protein
MLILDESDFIRLYMRLKEERASLEEKRQLLYAEEKAPMAKQAQVKQLVERFF